MSTFYKSPVTFSSSSSGKLLFSSTGSESVFSQVGLQLQKAVHESFLFTVVLFTHLHRRVEQLPEKNKENDMITSKMQFS